MTTEGGPVDTSDPEARDWTLELVRQESERPRSEMPRWHCQNGRSDVCLASNFGTVAIICPHDSCDIDDGVRCVHLRS